jgi:hypothetical protein
MAVYEWRYKRLEATMDAPQKGWGKSGLISLLLLCFLSIGATLKHEIKALLALA